MFKVPSNNDSVTCVESLIEVVSAKCTQHDRCGAKLVDMLQATKAKMVNSEGYAQRLSGALALNQLG
jgi:hypothetical protein